MIQHFLEERFHKAVRFFSSLTAKDLDVRGNVKIDGGLTVGGVDPARPYKVYTALLNQSGGNAPVATVLENTLGGIPVWTTETDGVVRVTLAGVFTANKTFVISPIGHATDFGIITATINNDYIEWINDGETNMGGWTYWKYTNAGIPIEIRVYE